MPLRISPLWWPLLVLLSPVLVVFLILRNRLYIKNQIIADEINRESINSTLKTELPELEFLEMKVVVEEKVKDGFGGDSGISYLFRSNLGTLLFDVGFGEERPSFIHNIKKLNIDVNSIDAFAVSHLHPDHMGGLDAYKRKTVKIPGLNSAGKTCFIPDKGSCAQAKCEIVIKPMILEAGIASTGPLARSLYFLGYTLEQSLVANIKGKGLVVFTGCGHPKIETVLELVKKMSDIPVYAVGGGLHFPITDGRGNRMGIKFQTFMGTGKPPWQRVNRKDLLLSVDAINRTKAKKIYLSGHDSCDNSLGVLEEKLEGEVIILKAGEKYLF